MHLMNVLPNYLPKSNAIVFQCVLGKDVIRTLDIHNPTNKAISYWVKYEGAPDFVLESDDYFKIEPKQSYQFRIRFISRVSLPVQGRVTFTNKRESSISAATLVYDLKSQIVGRVSEEVHQVTSSLYEQKEFSIQIVNKFNTADFGNF